MISNDHFIIFEMTSRGRYKFNSAYFWQSNYSPRAQALLDPKRGGYCFLHGATLAIAHLAAIKYRRVNEYDAAIENSIVTWTRPYFTKGKHTGVLITLGIDYDVIPLYIYTFPSKKLWKKSIMEIIPQRFTDPAKYLFERYYALVSLATRYTYTELDEAQAYFQEHFDNEDTEKIVELMIDFMLYISGSTEYSYDKLLERLPSSANSDPYFPPNWNDAMNEKYTNLYPQSKLESNKYYKLTERKIKKQETLTQLSRYMGSAVASVVVSYMSW